MLVLGIDTGGTYTDSVILDRERGRVLYTAKAPTTRDALAVGVGDSVGRLGFRDWRRIGLVCLSTTLATNAIVEGKGGRAGLILLGGVPGGRLPAEDFELIGARMDIRGGECAQIRDEEVCSALERMRGKYDALAISGYASVRNPLHEQYVKERAKQLLNIPAVCGHELTSSLGFYERTVTALLNARLIPIAGELLETGEAVVRQLGISAPVMMVRGDGSLMKLDMAAERPVETILSGPAASVLGARFLSGKQDCLTVDMGGTTTDIACVRNGECKVSEEGARIAGFRTRVRAMGIHTWGLGGDSLIQAVPGPGSEARREGKPGKTAWKIGPERVVPLCRGGEGMTPTDVLHLSGAYLRWDESKCRERALDLAEELGVPPEQFARDAAEQICSRLSDCCRQSAQEFGAAGTGRKCNAGERAPISIPIVGVGAPAGTWLRLAESRLDAPVVIPPYAEVANAVGAAAGRVKETAGATIRPNRGNGTYFIYLEKKREIAESLEDALCIARTAICEAACQRAESAGLTGAEASVSMERKVDEAGELVEIRLTAIASGWPS